MSSEADTDSSDDAGQYADANEILRLQLDQEMKSRAVRREAIDNLTSLRSAPHASRWRYVVNIGIGAAYGWLLHFIAPNLPWPLCLVAGVGFFVSISAYVECIALRKRMDAVVTVLLEKRSG